MITRNYETKGERQKLEGSIYEGNVTLEESCKHKMEELWVTPTKVSIFCDMNPKELIEYLKTITEDDLIEQELVWQEHRQR